MTNMTVERAPSVVSEFQKWLMTTDSRVEGDVSLAAFPFSRVASHTRCAETLWYRSRAQQCLFLDSYDSASLLAAGPHSFDV